jgi:hypothetical protein
MKKMKLVEEIERLKNEIQEKEALLKNQEMTYYPEIIQKSDSYMVSKNVYAYRNKAEDTWQLRINRASSQKTMHLVNCKDKDYAEKVIIAIERYENFKHKINGIKQNKA